jgi:hypothetical protein
VQIYSSSGGTEVEININWDIVRCTRTVHGPRVEDKDCADQVKKE